jgi:sulfhydrogenase subunit beta (sulfur reductase)
MAHRIESAALQSLIEVLQQRSYTVLGPTPRDGAIVYDFISSSADLPKGWTEDQLPGHYRLQKGTGDACFGFTVGPQSWKKFLFPPTIRLFSAFRNGKTLTLPRNGSNETDVKAKKLAFFGVRSCELHAIGIQDKVFLGSAYQDPHYRKLREQLFVVAVNCARPADTCFCTSMNTGPKASGGYDIVITEVAETQGVFYVAETGTPLGEEVLKSIQRRRASAEDLAKSEAALTSAAASVKRTLDTRDIKDLLYQNHEHAEWEKVAARCLTCTNCTMVCPTCFCHTIDDATDLIGSEGIRNRRWDSCFTLDFSYIHGGSVRISTKARYRQWMTHKLAAWIDQFGTSGCVGCGRCITWCPVGIDITEEARIIREGGASEKDQTT